MAIHGEWENEELRLASFSAADPEAYTAGDDVVMVIGEGAGQLWGGRVHAVQVSLLGGATVRVRAMERREP